MALVTPAVGGRPASAAVARAPLPVIQPPRRMAYRLPIARQAPAPTLAAARDYLSAARDSRFDRPVTTARPPIRDPQADCVRTLLKDRMARGGGALDARVQWRLTGGGSDVGLGGGLARVVDTILHD